MKNKKIKIATLVGTPIAASLLIIGTASADTSNIATKIKNKGRGFGQSMSEKRPHDTTALASILGMTETDLNAALSSGTKLDTLISQKGLTKDYVLTTLKAEHEAEMQTRLAADVASGKITQAQADEMKARRKQEESNMKTNLANILGISVETLDAEMKAGTTMDELAVKHGLTKDALHQKLDAAREAEMKARLAADVASGKITQAQADKMAANKGKFGKGPRVGHKSNQTK